MNGIIGRSWSTALLLVAAVVVGRGQFSNTGQVDSPDNYSSEPQGQYEVEIDTSDIYYFFADNPGEEYTFADSLLGNYFNQQDPIRRRDLDYANLGILGSAARPIVYQPLYRMGFDLGMHQFDIYQTLATELPFYRIEKAYTDVGYYQTGEQADAAITAQFSRDFADGLNFSIDYNRISQAGTRNQFPNQRVRNTALAGGLWYHSPSGKYDGFFSVAWNTIEQQDNGGVLIEPGETDEGLESPSSAVVFLPEAQTRYARRGIAYTQYFTFGKGFEEGLEDEPPRLRRDPFAMPGQRPEADSLGMEPIRDSLRIIPDTLNQAATPDSLSQTADSLNVRARRDSLPAGLQINSRQAAPPAAPPPDPDRRRYTLAHRIHLQTNRYKFFDPNPDGDPLSEAYYGPFLVDDRGVRFYTQYQQVENSFRLRTYKPRVGEEEGAKRQRDLFEAGINHRLTWIDMEIADSVVNNLFLFGRLNFSPSERLRINTYGHFGLFDQAGDYRVFGELFFSVGKIGQLSGSVNNQLYAPNLIQERYIGTHTEIWANDFQKTLETNLTATYSLPQWNFSVTGAYHLLNNYIYYDTLGVARQTGTPISIVQLIVQKDFHLGPIHLDNLVTLQQSSEDFIRLPDFYTKHSLYYEGYWFRVLNVRFGADLRMAATYYPYTYHPAVGQFILQDRQEIQLYPSVDAFFSLRVTKFRAFAKFENLTRVVIPHTERLFYLNARYPLQTGSGFRLGIRWRFAG